MAVAGLILAIVSLVLSPWGITSIIALPLAIVGLVLAVKGKNQLIAQGKPSGLGTAAMVLGIIAVVLTAITFFTCGICTLCVVGSGAALSNASSFYY